MLHNFSFKTKEALRQLIFFLLVISFFSIAHGASAATLNMVPSVGTYTVGDNFSTSITIDSSDQATNAVEATVSFPTDKLEVTSVSKNGSIINLWVADPTYSNTDGTVTISGVVLNPGFTGTGGKVLQINFKAKKSGNAAVVFSSGSVLANDGLGTNILDALNGAQYTLVDKKATPPVKTPTSTSGTINNLDSGDAVPLASSTISPMQQNTEVENPSIANNPREEISFFSIFTSVFVRTVGRAIEDIFFLLLLIAFLALLYVLVLRIWHGVALLQFRLKNKLHEMNINQYQDARKKADDEFLTGNYIGALALYQKLQEQTPVKKQAELNEKINKASDFLIAAANFKRANAFARYNKWSEVLTLLEDSEAMMDMGFIYHPEVKALHDKAKEHLEQITEQKKQEETERQKKISDAQSLAQENKEKFIQEQSLLSAEKERREERERDNVKTTDLLKEKEIIFARDLENAEIRAREKEATFRQELENKEARKVESENALKEEQRKLEVRIAEEQRKLSEALSVLEETKIELVKEQTLHAGEKSKREHTEEENKNLGNLLQENKTALADALNSTEQVKLELVKEKDLLQAEKTKNETLTQEIKELESIVKEKDISIKEIQAQNEFKIKEKEITLQKSLEVSQMEMAEREGAHQKELTSYEEKIKNNEVEFKKLIDAKDTELKKLAEVRESEFKKLLETSEKKLALQEADSIKEIDAIEAKMKAKDVEFKKNLETAEVKNKQKEGDLKKDLETLDSKMKDKEATLKKAVDAAQREIDSLKEKLTMSEKLVKETKEKLSREQDLLSAEKSKSENLLSAISQFIKPNP